MANRDTTVAVQTQLAAEQNEPCHLMALYLDGLTVRVTDAWRTLSWGGYDYTALGHFVAFDGLEESAELQVTSVKLSLSGVTTDTIAELLTYQYIDRRVVIWKAFISGSTVVADPVPIFDGRADAPEIAEDPDSGTCIVTLSAAQHWVDFERRPGRHTNHAEQQIWFSGDKGFEFVSELNREIRWGRT